jgi:hypothetical protein
MTNQRSNYPPATKVGVTLRLFGEARLDAVTVSWWVFPRTWLGFGL